MSGFPGSTFGPIIEKCRAEKPVSQNPFTEISEVYRTVLTLS